MSRPRWESNLRPWLNVDPLFLSILKPESGWESAMGVIVDKWQASVVSALCLSPPYNFQFASQFLSPWGLDGQVRDKGVSKVGFPLSEPGQCLMDSALLCLVTGSLETHVTGHLSPTVLWAFVVAFQSVSHVWLFAAPWTAALQASLSLTVSQNLLKFMSIESVMPSNHLILCCPLLLLPSVFASIRVFSNESTVHIRWPKYWNFSFSTSPSNEYSGLSSVRIDWFCQVSVCSSVLCPVTTKIWSDGH